MTIKKLSRSRRSRIYNLIRHTAIFGNVMYILWILYNGIDEGFKDIASIQGLSYLGLLVLLALNLFLLYR